ncbi:MAG: carbohydrate binding protein cbp2A [Candidatus Parcubacteria bacterium]|jgi:hypothetical protein
MALRGICIVLSFFLLTDIAFAKCPTLPRNIEFGDIGSDVADLHAFLKTQGIAGDEGNIFGEKTLDAIRFFQASLTLKETGIVDAQTRKKIAELCKSEASVVVRDSIAVRPTKGFAPLKTTTTITLGDGADNTFLIDFGDGTTAKASACTSGGSCKTTLQGKHTYEQPGRYAVRLFRDYGASDVGQKALSGKLAVMQVIVHVEDPRPELVPETCKEWFDGCSVCTRKSIGAALSCQKKVCYGKTQPRACKGYFYINKPPLVKVAGPTNIRNGIIRHYEVTALDPERSTVTYAIDWGDGTTENPPRNFYRTGKFTHRYKDGGWYTITAFAKDAAGDVGKSTLRVFVRDARDELVCDSVAAPVCGTVKVCTGTECKEEQRTFGNECLMDKAHATKVAKGRCR